MEPHGATWSHQNSQAWKLQLERAKARQGATTLRQLLRGALFAGAKVADCSRMPGISGETYTQLPLRDMEIKGEPFGAMTTHWPTWGN